MVIQVPPGWTSIAVLVFVLSGLQMLMLGVLGEYFARMLDEVRPRPRYIIERISSTLTGPTADDVLAAHAAPAMRGAGRRLQTWCDGRRAWRIIEENNLRMMRPTIDGSGHRWSRWLAIAWAAAIKMIRSVIERLRSRARPFDRLTMGRLRFFGRILRGAGTGLTRIPFLRRKSNVRSRNHVRTDDKWGALQDPGFRRQIMNHLSFVACSNPKAATRGCPPLVMAASNGHPAPTQWFRLACLFASALM
jgi:hypothetical protein